MFWPRVDDVSVLDDCWLFWPKVESVADAPVVPVLLVEPLALNEPEADEAPPTAPEYVEAGELVLALLLLGDEDVD